MTGDGQAGVLRKALRPATWTRDASCLGRASGAVDPWSPDEDLPKRQRDLLVAQARVVCADCPVRHPCAVEALESEDPYGVRGGLTPEDRRAVAARFGYKPPGSAQCGTRSHYVSGCRTDDCKRANARYRAERRAIERQRAEALAAAEEVMAPRDRVVAFLGRQRRPVTAREVYRHTGAKVRLVRAWAAEAEAAGQLKPGRLAA